jgi:putative endonuclease
MPQYYVYILRNWSGILYTGVTNDLQKRVYEHKHHLGGGFTKKYNVNSLVYYEETDDINSAIAREQQIKGMASKQENCVSRCSKSAVAGSQQRLVRQTILRPFALLRVTLPVMSSIVAHANCHSEERSDEES